MDILVDYGGGGQYRLLLVGGMVTGKGSRLLAEISGFDSRAEAELAAMLLAPHCAAVDDWVGFDELGGVLTAVARQHPEVFGRTPVANGWDKGIRGVAAPFGITRQEY